MTPESLVRTAVGGTVVAIDTAVFATAAIAGAGLLGSTHPLVNRCFQEWSRFVLLGCGARLVTNGDGHLDPAGRYVFASNHLSNLDPPAILRALPNHAVRFVAKQELERVPLFGAALRMTGNVIVTRSDTNRDVARLDEQRELLRRVSVLFFAEGTRSASGTLGPFKRGAAAFAIKNEMPLVPIGVQGSFEILPRVGGVQRGGTIAVSVGPPLPCRGRSFDERSALTDELREGVVAEIERARALL